MSIIVTLHTPLTTETSWVLIKPQEDGVILLLCISFFTPSFNMVYPQPLNLERKTQSHEMLLLLFDL